MDPSMDSSAQHKVFRDLMALLDVLTVPLIEGSLPGIVSSMEPGHLMAKTSMLIQHLHQMHGQDLVNVLLFFSAIAFARKDAVGFLTDELVEKTYRQMTHAESQSYQEIVGAAMTLLANIASHRFEAVIEYLMLHLQQLQNSVLKTLALIFTNSSEEFVPHLMHVMLKITKMGKLTTDSGIQTTIHQTMPQLAKVLRKFLAADIESKRLPERRLASCIILNDLMCYPLPKKEIEEDSQKFPCRHLAKTSVSQKISTVDDLVRHQPFKAETSMSCDFHYHLLHQSYGFTAHEEHSYLLYNSEKSKTAMCAYITHVLTDEEIRRKVIYYLLEAMLSPFRSSKLISVIFFSELLLHPELLEKRMAENITTIMAGKIKSSDELEVCLAIEAIGNATKTAPRQVKDLKDFIFHDLSKKLDGFPQREVAIQTLQTMSKCVRLLKSSELGNNFERIVCHCTKYLYYRNPQIQAYSASLMADLAQKCDKDKCSCFKNHIKNCLPALLIKLYSKDQQVKASGIAALLHCLPYIGCNSTEKLLSADAKEIWKLYEQLGQEEPAFLVNMMLRSIPWLYEGSKADVLKHLTMIKDYLPYEELYPTALRDLWKELRGLRKPPHPFLVQVASDRAVDILSTKWKSIGTVKVTKVGTRRQCRIS